MTEEIKEAHREVYSAWESIAAARQARYASEEALSAIEQREQAGQNLTPEFLQLKLDRQSTLAEAQRAEAQAIARYNVALSNLEKVKGTLLRYNNIRMKEEPGPMFTKYGSVLWEGGRRFDP